MKNFRFYAEMPQERKSKSASKSNPFFPWTVESISKIAAINSAKHSSICDVVAVILDDHGKPLYGHEDRIEAISTAIEGNDFSYSHNAISREYLNKRCTRIGADLARQIAPNLFARIAE